MTVNELSRQLKTLKSELQDKQVKVLIPNGEIMCGKVKFVLKDKMNFDLTNENVDYIYITCD